MSGWAESNRPDYIFSRWVLLATYCSFVEGDFPLNWITFDHPKWNIPQTVPRFWPLCDVLLLYQGSQRVAFNRPDRVTLVCCIKGPCLFTHPYIWPWRFDRTHLSWRRIPPWGYTASTSFFNFISTSGVWNFELTPKHNKFWRENVETLFRNWGRSISLFLCKLTSSFHWNFHLSSKLKWLFWIKCNVISSIIYRFEKKWSVLKG